MSQAGSLYNPGGSGGSGIEQITGNSGSVVTPTAGNVNILGGTNTTTVGSSSTLTINVLPTTYTYTNVALTSPYAAQATDYYIGVTTSGTSKVIQLPNAPVTGRVFIVKDITGLANTNNITVTTVGGVVTIDGATTFVMNTSYEAAQFMFNGTSYEVF